MYQSLSAEMSAIADDMADAGIGPAKGSGARRWVRKVWVDEQGASTGTIVWSPRRAPADPVALAQQALRYVPLPAPSLGMSPAPGRDQLVNVATWLWVDFSAWQPVSASAAAGGIRVTTTARPQRVVWDLGDGTAPVVCDGPGTPYDPARATATPSCAYTYRRPSGHLVVTATVEWAVRWSSSAGGGGDLGVVRRSASVPVQLSPPAVSSLGS